jgi:hypothetical protein
MDPQSNLLSSGGTLLSSETAEMVPDEFLSWLMSDLENKEVSAAGAGSDPGPLHQAGGQFRSYEVAAVGGNSGISGSSSAAMAYQHQHVVDPHATDNIPVQPVSSPRGTDDDGDGEGDDSDQEQEDSEKVGEKRKVPRSREIAKECRRRQRERKEELERRVATLKKENEELREHFQNVSQRTTDIQRQRASMEGMMQSRLREIEQLPEDSEEKKNLASLVRKFTDLYADYGSCRQKEIAFHLAQLEKLILPTQITKMILWTLQQDYKFFEEKSSPIWGILVKELDITPEQINFLKKQRSEVMQLLLHLKESLSLINELKVSIKDKHETFDRECGKINSQASPNQIVRFILWITNNAEKLGKVIPDFERIVPHVSHAPNVSMPK